MAIDLKYGADARQGVVELLRGLAGAGADGVAEPVGLISHGLQPVPARIQ